MPLVAKLRYDHGIPEVHTLSVTGICDVFRDLKTILVAADPKLEEEGLKLEEVFDFVKKGKYVIGDPKEDPVIIEVDLSAAENVAGLYEVRHFSHREGYKLPLRELLLGS